MRKTNYLLSTILTFMRSYDEKAPLRTVVSFVNGELKVSADARDFVVTPNAVEVLTKDPMQSLREIAKKIAED